MVVKIDNTGSSNPQVGLGEADLVAEELVEGGSTRLAVFYHSQVPDKVGPVRSMRASDLGIIEPADAVLVASGGAPQTVKRVKDAGVKAMTEGAPGYFRDNSRSAPYNLFMDLPKLAETLKSDGAPEGYFPWGTEEDFPKGQPAGKISATFSGGHTTNWQFKKGSYVNLNSEAPANDQFDPATVLVLRVKVGDAGYKDPAGNPVPETKFTGKGEAMVFHDGSMVRATWSKSGLDAPVKLADQGRRAHPARGQGVDGAGPQQRRGRQLQQVRRAGQPASSPGPGASSVTRSSGPGSLSPDSACWRSPARMNVIAASTSALARRGSSAEETADPAADIAPKKTRLKVSTMLGSRA